MRFLLRIESRSARLRAAGQRAGRGLSRASDANGAGVLRRARADRADARWCAAPTPSSSPRPTRRRRARRSRVRCVRRTSRPRVRNRRRRATNVPTELMPAGVRRRRRRHRRVQHVAVARADRACGAFAARVVRARETVGDDAPRFSLERCCLVLAREMML
jgi:hypothetical protein